MSLLVLIVILPGSFFIRVDFIVRNFNLTLVVGSVLKLLSLPETDVLHLFSKSHDLVSFQVFLKCHFIFVTFLSIVRICCWFILIHLLTDPLVLFLISSSCHHFSKIKWSIWLIKLIISYLSLGRDISSCKVLLVLEVHLNFGCGSCNILRFDHKLRLILKVLLVLWSFDADLHRAIVIGLRYLIVNVHHLMLHSLNLTRKSTLNRIDKGVHLVNHVVDFFLDVLVLGINGSFLVLYLVFKAWGSNSSDWSWFFLTVFCIWRRIIHLKFKLHHQVFNI